MSSTHPSESQPGPEPEPGRPSDVAAEFPKAAKFPKAAGGVAGLIRSAQALYHAVVPTTSGLDESLDAFDALEAGSSTFFLPTEKRPWLRRVSHTRRAALSTFGFGGSNFHGVLEEHRLEKAGIDWDPDVEIVALAATNVDRLRELVESFPTAAAWPELAARAAALRGQFDPLANCRLVLVIERGTTDVPTLFKNAAALLASRRTAREWSTPDGAHFGQGSILGKLAVLFPGQGSQYVGMLRDLACRFPAVQHALETADQAFELAASGLAGGVSVGLQLSDRIFPQAAWSDAVREAAERVLRDTRVAQPAIGAVSVGALAALMGAFAVTPAAYAGHSYGELAALSAAHGWDSGALIDLSFVRGDLMAQGDGGRGAMLALATDVSGALEILHDGSLVLSVANLNAPGQTVLSGTRDEIARAEEICTERGVRSTRLPVSAAFHSPLVGGAAGPLRAALDALPFEGASAPVYANATAAPYPDDPNAARDLLAQQLASSVDWVGVVERMHDDGVRTFLEVGPRGHLTSLVSRILDGRDHNAIALDASSGRRNGMHDLAAALARLAAAGHGIALDAWNASDAPAGNGRSGTVATTPVTDANANADALASLSEQMAALLRLQDETAAAHRRFLADQAAAQRALVSLMHRQESETLLAVPPVPAPPADVPVPVSVSMPVPEATPLSTQTVPPSAWTSPLASSASARQVAPIHIAPARAPAVVPTPSAEPTATDDLAPLVFDVVSELTGYPVDMLGLEMELDADLGIDSIKRVEIVSALQARRPSLPTVPSDDLGALRTLGDVVTTLASAAAPDAIPAPAHTSGPDLSALLLEVVAERTGYPTDMLALDMELDADLGIDSIKRVEILSAMQAREPTLPVIAAERLGGLRTLGDVVAELGAPDVAREARAGAVTPVERAERAVSDHGNGVVRASPAPRSVDLGLDTGLPAAFEREVSVASHPVLADHVIGGRSVLPVVLMAEWMAHGALHGSPGLRFHGLDDLRVLAGLEIVADESVSVRVHAGGAERDGDGAWRVPVELRSELRGDGGQRGDALHARAVAVLVDQLPDAPATPEEPAGAADDGPLYTERLDTGRLDTGRLFHGPALHAIRSVGAVGPEGISGDVATAATPAEWMDAPLRGRFLTAPLALDGAFQLMVLWTRAECDAPSLPTAIGRLRVFATEFPRAGVRAVARVRSETANIVTADLALVDAAGRVLLSADGFECVADASLDVAYAARSLSA